MSASETRFAQLLEKYLKEDKEKALSILSSPAHMGLVQRPDMPPDAATTGMQCARYVGRVEGLQFALNLIKFVEDELFGNSKEKAA